MMEAPSTQGRGGDTLVKKNTVLVVGGTGTLGRQVRAHTRSQSFRSCGNFEDYRLDAHSCPP